MLEGDHLRIARAVGRVAEVEEKLDQLGGFAGTLGIAHTRWATHGGVTEANAHPHRDDKSGIALVHNGIIENYAALRTYLEEKGHVFQSETDTEVLAMLVGELYEGDLEKAVQGRPARGHRAPTPSPSSAATSPTCSWSPARAAR